jgi:hypothetical protein
MATTTKPKKRQPSVRKVANVIWDEIRIDASRPGFSMGFSAEPPGIGTPINTRYQRRLFKPLADPARFRLVNSNWDGALGQPNSYVQLPTADRYESCFEWPDVSPMTRAEAMKQVAAANRVSFEARGKVGVLEDWMIIAELGDGVAKLTDLELQENGIGVETRKEERPLRLVAPTADELKRYAIGKAVRA